MWPMHDFPFLKPACSWRSSLSTAVVMRQKTPISEGQYCNAYPVVTVGQIPFLWEFGVFQASGITSLSKTSWRMRLRSGGISCSVFSISACTLSSTGALPFFSFLIASLTWMVMGPYSMSRSCSASLMSARLGVSHRLRSC